MLWGLSSEALRVRELVRRPDGEHGVSAADLGYRAPPSFQPALPYSWSGVYLGANAGYGFAHETAAISAGGTTFNAPT